MKWLVVVLCLLTLPLYAQRHRSVVGPAGNPNLVLYDDFESGSLSAGWSIVAGDTVNTPAYYGISGPVGGGTYIAKCMQYDVSRGLKKNSTLTDVWLKFKIYSDDIDHTNSNVFFHFEGAGEANVVYGRFRHFDEWDGAIHVTTGTGGAFVTPDRLTNNTWYTIKVHLVYSTTVGVFQLWVDGVSKIDQSGLNISAASPTTVMIGGGRAGGNTIPQYVDDVGIYTADPDL